MDLDLKSKSVFICGCARNVAPNLPGVLSNFERIAALFGESRFGIVENDSSDNTRELVKAWCDRDPQRRTHIDLTGLVTQHRSRTDRLPICRNALLDEMWKNPPDFMVMMDMDGICEEPIPIPAFLSSFDHDDWAVMTANVSCEYYDIWALRSDWCPYDCWQMVYSRPAGMSESEATQKYVLSHKVVIPPERGFIEVESAFGGLGIYQVRYLNGCRHSKVSTYGTEDAEHCAFNQAIRANGGRVFINARMLIR